MRLRVVILVYLALFVAELSWSGVTPLIPSYIEQYDLTDFQGGLVLSVASLGILIASVPASYVTRRITPRTLTLASMAVIAVAGMAMAVAPGYWSIVAARFVFGLGFGTLYVSMAVWLDDASGNESARGSGPDHSDRRCQRNPCPCLRRLGR
jgi:DHA1 family inner membrane transport protein